MKKNIVKPGANYPQKVTKGAAVGFFSPGGTTLCIGELDPTLASIKDYQHGSVRFGLVDREGVILSLWKFGNQPWVEASFDAPLARRNRALDLVTIGPGSNLVVRLHFVDAMSNVVLAVRAFTLSYNQTISICHAIHSQLSRGSSQVELQRMQKVPTEALASVYEVVPEDLQDKAYKVYSMASGTA